MAHVAALYRYPVKGLTPEACDALDILPSGRVAGDRVLGVRFASTPAADDAWSPKAGMLALVNTPGLARLKVRFDHAGQRLCLDLDGERLVEAALDAEGRRAIAQRLAEYALSLEINPLAGHPERLPLRLVGDGTTPRYHDSEHGQVSLHGRGSLRALAAALGETAIDERRFRSNIAVEGLDAWAELTWVGQQVRIGQVEFTVAKTKTRCLATHANPQTGQRDLPVLTTLAAAFGQAQPTFAIALVPTGTGQVRVGDRVEVVAAHRSSSTAHSSPQHA